MWQVIKDPGSDFIQIIPVNDLEPHYEKTDCRCEPRVDHCEDGTRDLLIHNAFDGREN